MNVNAVVEYDRLIRLTFSLQRFPRCSCISSRICRLKQLSQFYFSSGSWKET